ncbi:dihydrolipoyl dehydrogenase [Collibacillus ludicampi]|uniref:Dihydrolipoyl dehydrogenase n=1 Tax=Collibacillus ludicampi TaxID=2771369 RepID=A0AAV4LGX9_9BACL|nr:dihydrolipoyl dehydrogenase [Collibacillus ludicampi]GIM46968.1 dihydrolipoyl dehydrogenase [Collibacillus ludicampi]
MVVGEFSQDVDVMVIGAGPGGYVAAIHAAMLGKQVTLIEKGELGGVCLNRGCIPSKALIAAAHRHEMIKHSEDIGFSVQGVHINWDKIQTWKQSVVDKLTSGVGSLLKSRKVQILEGEALFVSPNEIRVFKGYEVQRYRFNHCIIATGSRPVELKAFPFGGRILSSTEALSLQEIPKSLVIIGGGYIGVELGQMFAKFGAKVTVLEGAERILLGFDAEMTRWVERRLKKSGIDVYTNAKAKEAIQQDDQVTVTFETGNETKQVTADYLLVTAGRVPNTENLGLDVAGVKVNDRGLIEVDNQCKTNVPGIYAIGDIVPGPALAHKASYEGKIAAEVIAGHPSIVDYKAIPAVVFSDPGMASVGLDENLAKEKGYEVISGKFPYAANGRALSLHDSEGFVKIVAEKERGIVLGAQIVGPEASNLIAELGLAVEMGATLEDLALTIHAHPTLGEMVMEAAEAALGRATHIVSK